MTLSPRWLVIALALLVFISALAVVYTKHQSRRLFVELHALQTERDDLNVEWGRLQLEQGTWATHGRIEQTSRERLGMKIPPNEDVVIIHYEH